jgi:hypothetical protein
MAMVGDVESEENVLRTCRRINCLCAVVGLLRVRGGLLRCPRRCPIVVGGKGKKGNGSTAAVLSKSGARGRTRWRAATFAGGLSVRSVSPHRATATCNTLQRKRSPLFSCRCQSKENLGQVFGPATIPRAAEKLGWVPAGHLISSRFTSRRKKKLGSQDADWGDSELRTRTISKDQSSSFIPKQLPFVSPS